MTIDRILRAYRARPFVPFTIHVAGERSIRIAHPELFFGQPDQRTIAVYDDKEDIYIIDLLFVTDLHLETGHMGTPFSS